MKDNLRRLWRRLTDATRKSGLDREFQAELTSHVDMLSDELRQQGMSPEDARRAALIKLGALEPTRELHRETRGLPFFDNLAQDLSYTFRTMRREAAFTTFAIVIVGLGIGASISVFSVVNALLLRSLPFRDANQLVWLINENVEGLSGQTVQVDNFLDFKKQNQSFSDMAGYMAFYGSGDNNLTGAGDPERLNGVQVSQNFFQLLGVVPQLGRYFTDEECKWNGAKAVLLSHGLWERRFSSDTHIVGRAIILNDQPYTVAGVLPASFSFGSVFAPGTNFDLFSPFPLTSETNRWGNTLLIVGRLKPGVKLQTAQAEATILAKQIQQAHPERNMFGAVLSLLSDHVSGRLRTALLVLSFAVGLVMLIVCANLSNLLLARTATRRKEIAVRIALGAGRMRLIKQMLTESIVLSCCGGALGLLLAFAGTKALSNLQSLNIPLLETVHVDPAALGFTLLIALVTGILFGLLPAIQLPGVSLHDTLKETTRGSSDGRGHGWIRNALVISEVAFACVLLIGAGLLIRSFLRVLDIDLGFHPERTAALRIDPGPKYTTREQVNTYYNEALRRAKEIPGVEVAGLTDSLPLGKNRTWSVEAVGHIYPREEMHLAFVHIISDGYFQTMGIPLRAGRDLTERDTVGTAPVIVINESMARDLWPGENALGKKMKGGPERQVVGIVGDVHHLSVELGAGSEMYIPVRQTGDVQSVDLVVRTSLAPADLAGAIRAALTPMAPNLAMNEFRTLQTMVDRSVSPRRFIVTLLGAFALFALLLASLGIYGVISYSVSQRSKEIGIRMALGASAGDLQRRILLQTLGLAAAGLFLGVGAAIVLGRSLRGLLYGITATDPLTFLAILTLLALVAGAAGYFPARRASKIDPMVALRAN